MLDFIIVYSIIMGIRYLLIYNRPPIVAVGGNV